MTLTERIRLRLRYARTRQALRQLPPHVAADLGITRGDVDRVAWRTVYGDPQA